MLSKAVNDVGWSSFINMLAYKAENAGKGCVGPNLFRDDLDFAKRRCGRTNLNNGRIVGNPSLIGLWKGCPSSVHDSMRSAEIPPYNPTYRGLMLPASVL